MERMNIKEDDLNLSKELLNRKIKLNIEILMNEDLENEAKSKSKVKKYLKQIHNYQVKRKDYMNLCSKFDAKSICLTRCGLFPCKENFKFHYKDDMKSRWCK